MQNCVDALVQIIGDVKEDEPVMLLIECASFLINLLASKQSAEADRKINHYQELIRTKYPGKLVMSFALKLA